MYKKNYKYIKILLLSLAISSVVFTGCARVGVDFDAQKVREIKLNETTKNDILSMFGKPWREGIQNGVEMWTYGRYTYRVVGDADTKDLVVKFTKEGKVFSYTYNKTMQQ